MNELHYSHPLSLITLITSQTCGSHTVQWKIWGSWASWNRSAQWKSQKVWLWGTHFEVKKSQYIQIKYFTSWKQNFFQYSRHTNAQHAPFLPLCCTANNFQNPTELHFKSNQTTIWTCFIQLQWNSEEVRFQRENSIIWARAISSSD